MSVHVFGIRHHGPGCARSLRAALDELAPDVVVVEGPTDAEEALPLAAHEEMRPPVAMLIYPPEEPRRAVYYPLTVFSPEWQTFRWALAHKVPLRLMDLPQTQQMALAIEEEKHAAEAAGQRPGEEPASEEPPSHPEPIDSEQAATSDSGGGEAANGSGKPVEETWQADPLAVLAEAAGYRDHELWWEEQIERRENAAGLFSAILEAMRAVRAEMPQSRPRDLLREAHMRQTLRAVVKEGFARVAVVCGAWHAPVLDEESLAGKLPELNAKGDAASLKNLPKVKTAVTWIPWTNDRLSYRSGYGAGVASPGWYAHLWHAPQQASIRWITTAAQLLRAADLDASPASVIEAVRLADALAAIRRLRGPGLAELGESILTVLCHGDPAPMRLIRRRLEIGDELGAVPSESPAVPLARDVQRWQKSLRLAATTEITSYDLDLRKENDLARSRLLHRLKLLGVEWGAIERTGSKVSTFHEVWRLQWQPEFEVALIEANVWGNTVESAATAKVVADAAKATDLVPITETLDQAILADLAATIDPLLQLIQERAAVASDTRHLLSALLPLARVSRYGDVRGTQSQRVLPVLLGLFERGMVGLSAACASLDDDAAEQMVDCIAQAHQAVELLQLADLREEWLLRLQQLADGDIHGLVRGWCCRLLREQCRIDDEALVRITGLALSLAGDAAAAAAWLRGLLRGSGLLLLHQDALWKAIDRWLGELAPERFTETLPLIRRAFADFTPPERRQMGEKVKRLTPADTRAPSAKTKTDRLAVHAGRAARVMPVLKLLIGEPS
jgi:hypothetical protein